MKFRIQTMNRYGWKALDLILLWKEFPRRMYPFEIPLSFKSIKRDRWKERLLDIHGRSRGIYTVHVNHSLSTSFYKDKTFGCCSLRSSMPIACDCSASLIPLIRLLETEFLHSRSTSHPILYHISFNFCLPKGKRWEGTEPAWHTLVNALT